MYKDIAPIRPEKVKTLEIGYRTTLLERLYLDASVYRNAYNDFIGYQVGLVIPEVLITPFPGSPPIPFKKYADTKVFRVAANSVETVVSQGFALQDIIIILISITL